MWPRREAPGGAVFLPFQGVAVDLFRVAVAHGDALHELPAGLVVVVLQLGDEVEPVVPAQLLGGLDAGLLEGLADVEVAELRLDVEHRHPGGQILAGLGVVEPEGHRTHRLAVHHRHQHLGHRVPLAGVAGAVDDLLQGVAVGLGPVLPQPAGDLLHVLRRVGQVDDLVLLPFHDSSS